jgi:hypothetical protein
MFLSLLRLDFVTAFWQNPMVFCLFWVWNAIALSYFFGKPKLVQSSRFLFAMLSLTILSLVFFGIFRNII